MTSLSAHIECQAKHRNKAASCPNRRDLRRDKSRNGFDWIYGATEQASLARQNLCHTHLAIAGACNNCYNYCYDGASYHSSGCWAGLSSQ